MYRHLAVVRVVWTFIKTTGCPVGTKCEAQRNLNRQACRWAFPS